MTGSNAFMELAAGFGATQSGGLIMATISAVFTIGYAANLLGDNKNRLHNLSINMFPEDGCRWVYSIGEDEVPAFQRRHENLRQIIADA